MEYYVRPNTLIAKLKYVIGLTLAIVSLSDFIKTKWYMILLVIFVIVFIFIQLFTKIQKFRESVQIFLMHVPVVKNIIIYNEIANFTKTFASLLNHGVFITDSMEILSKITNNEVYKRIINRVVGLINGYRRGKKS